MNQILLVLIILPIIDPTVSDKCKSPIFCQGDLLRTVQMAGIFKDSKTFVDMSLVGSTDRTLKNFDRLMSRTQGNPSKADIVDFLHRNFQASNNELEHWFPTDYTVNPPFLRKIKDVRIRNIAKKLVDIWPNLGRKIKPEVILNPFKYSIIPLPNGFIIPGGRFREIYYWDSYWIAKGLLICDMTHTVKGMIENFFKIIDDYGFIPNGGRIYYLDRSQPPVLTMMVADFMEVHKDVLWLRNAMPYLEKELRYWLNKKTVQIEKNGQTYRLARYLSSDDTPRPESYIEDIHTASRFHTEDEKRQCYTNLRTGAETGWDFSGRWFFDTTGGNRADLSTLNPIRLAPVDLNAFLAKNFAIMHGFYLKFHDHNKAKFWLQKSKEWNKAIEDLLYNQEDGIWYDFDVELRVQRKHFYPSNFAPLWTQSYDTSKKLDYGSNASKYFKTKGIMKYEGGIPSSLFETGEQWDLPNAWAPYQGIVILGLDKTQEYEAQKIASDFAHRWVDSLVKVAEETHEMFEKYNAIFRGMYGGGGEYEVQTGFGWTNGGMLELIERYFTKKADGNEKKRT